MACLRMLLQRSVVGVRGIVLLLWNSGPTGAVHPEALAPDHVIKVVRDQDVESLAAHLHGLQREWQWLDVSVGQSRLVFPRGRAHE